MITRIINGLLNGACNYAYFVIDNKSELEQLPTNEKRTENYSTCSLGSLVYVISEGKSYMLNGFNKWVEYKCNANSANNINNGATNVSNDGSSSPTVYPTLDIATEDEVKSILNSSK